MLDSQEPVVFKTPPDADTATNEIAQAAAAGTAIGITASADDPDAGSTVTYSINDPRFAIGATTGVITRSGTGTLDAQSEPTVNLTVTATSSDGSAATHAFSVSVTNYFPPTSLTPGEYRPDVTVVAGEPRPLGDGLHLSSRHAADQRRRSRRDACPLHRQESLSDEV